MLNGKTKVMSMQEYEHQVRTTGFCVLPGVIPDDAIPGIRASILKTTEEVGQQSYFAPSATVAIAGLINYDQYQGHIEYVFVSFFFLSNYSSHFSKEFNICS